MGYADLKNDVVFRKVFGQHPRVLAGLLNDLLDRSGEHAIVEIEYLSPEQVPLAMGRKLSILDVRCREKGGSVFIVEMQLLPVTAFLNRVVYNACKAYVGTLERGKPYHELTDVVAVSICDFVLWPDAERDGAGQMRVPLVSRWSITCSWSFPSSEITSRDRRTSGGQRCSRTRRIWSRATSRMRR